MDPNTKLMNPVSDYGAVRATEKGKTTAVESHGVPIVDQTRLANSFGIGVLWLSRV